MYAQLSEDQDAPLNGVIYVTDRHDDTRLVTRSAASVGLESLRLLTLNAVVQQTRTATRSGVAESRPRPSQAKAPEDDHPRGAPVLPRDATRLYGQITNRA
jgi:hypothetical protein